MPVLLGAYGIHNPTAASSYRYVLYCLLPVVTCPRGVQGLVKLPLVIATILLVVTTSAGLRMPCEPVIVVGQEAPRGTVGKQRGTVALIFGRWLLVGVAVWQMTA